MPYYTPSDDMPETLTPLFKYITDYFLPELEMNVEVMNKLTPGNSGSPATINPQMAVLGFGAFDHGGASISCAVRPIRFYMLQRVTDYFASMSKADQDGAIKYLMPMGLAPLLSLTADHRVERKNHIEVWA